MKDKSYPSPSAIIYSRFTYAWRFTRVPSVFWCNLKMAECCLLQLAANLRQYYDKLYTSFNSNWCVSCSTVISSTKLRYFLKKTLSLFSCCCRCEHSNWHWFFGTKSYLFCHFQNEHVTCWPSQNWTSFTRFPIRSGKPFCFKNRSASINNVFNFKYLQLNNWKLG